MKDELYGNKVAAAILTTLLLFFGLPILVSTFVGGGSHHGGGHHDDHHDPANPMSRAYPIEIVVGPAAAAEEPEKSLAELLANADPAKGERGAAICKSCHTLEKGGANGTGPNLYGIMGSQVASVSGFSYSSALTDFGGIWTYERLDPYLENSKAYIPGTIMAQKIRKSEKRADILAYLQTLADTPYPFPAVQTIETLIQEGEAEIDTATVEAVEN